MWDLFYVLVSILISVTAMVVSFKNINPYRLTIKEYIRMTFIIIVVYMIMYSFKPKLASIPSYFIPIIFIYKKSRKILESLILGLIISMIIIIVDSFTGTIFIKTVSESFLQSKIGYYISCVTILLVLYPVSKFIGRVLEKNKVFIAENYKSKYFILIYMILVSIFGLFYVNINWNKSSNPIYLTEANGIVFIVYGLTMITVFISLFFILKKEENFKYKQMQLDNLKEYTENVEQLYMDMRKFRHDYVNMLLTMAGFIEERDMDALARHFDKHIYPLNKRININNCKLGLLKNIGLPEIKSLISAKVIRAQELGVEIIIDVAEQITNIDMDIIDLSKCIGIIFDNAIESALESEGKKVTIALINTSESVMIVVVNTFKGELPPLNKLFKDGFSTKGKNRGLGLGNLKDIVGKYKDITLDTYINDGNFIQEIIINNKE